VVIGPTVLDPSAWIVPDRLEPVAAAPDDDELLLSRPQPAATASSATSSRGSATRVE